MGRHTSWASLFMVSVLTWGSQRQSDGILCISYCIIEFWSLLMYHDVSVLQSVYINPTYKGFRSQLPQLPSCPSCPWGFSSNTFAVAWRCIASTAGFYRWRLLAAKAFCLRLRRKSMKRGGALAPCCGRVTFFFLQCYMGCEERTYIWWSKRRIWANFCGANTCHPHPWGSTVDSREMWALRTLFSRSLESWLTLGKSSPNKWPNYSG